MFWDIFQFSLDNTMWSTQTNSWSQSTIPSHQIFKKWACTIVLESSSSKKKMYKCIWQNKNWTRTNLSKKCLLATDCLCHIKLTTFCVWTLLIWINQRLVEEGFSQPGFITVWIMLYCTLGIGTLFVGHVVIIWELCIWATNCLLWLTPGVWKLLTSHLYLQTVSHPSWFLCWLQSVTVQHCILTRGL